jgi:hypothetical protein
MTRPQPLPGEIYQARKGYLVKVAIISYYPRTKETLCTYYNADGKAYSIPLTQFLGYDPITGQANFTLVQHAMEATT